MVSEKKSGNFTLLHRIKDDQFNVDQISSYSLMMQVSPELFRICVMDLSKNKCLLLEDYRMSISSQPHQLIEKLHQIYDDHHVLKAGYWKSIKLAVKTPNFTLIPYSLFDQDITREYLTLNSTLKDDSSEEIFFYRQKSSDIVNVFSVEKPIIDYFIRAYPGKSIKVLHHTCAFIEAVLLNRSLAEQRAMYIYVEKTFFTLLVVKQKNLEFCNSFQYFSPEDFVYYTLFVTEQLQFNTDVSPLTLWGEVSPDGEIYKKLIKYIRNVYFGPKLASLYFGYQFDELPDHGFFDLYSMHFCD